MCNNRKLSFLSVAAVMAGVMTCFLVLSCQTHEPVQTSEYTLSDSSTLTISTISGLSLGGTSRTEKLKEIVASVNDLCPDIVFINGEIRCDKNRLCGESLWPLSELNALAFCAAEYPKDEPTALLLKAQLKSTLKVQVLESEDTIIYKGLTITQSSIKNNTVTEYEKIL